MVDRSWQCGREEGSKVGAAEEENWRKEREAGGEGERGGAKINHCAVYVVPPPPSPPLPPVNHDFYQNTCVHTFSYPVTHA